MFNNSVKFFIELCDDSQPKGRSQSGHKYTGKTKTNKNKKEHRQGQTRKLLLLLLLLLFSLSPLCRVLQVHTLKNHVSRV